MVHAETLDALGFQHTATRRWLRKYELAHRKLTSFNTQPPEGGCFKDCFTRHFKAVSTHSHPKVAAVGLGQVIKRLSGFNTQPPEGGCVTVESHKSKT